jgi:hypothetical protein
LAELKHVLPRLITAYEQGILVPFMGAGMSSGACPDWNQFIYNLEFLAEKITGLPASNIEDDTSTAEKIRRANAVVRTLKNSLSTPFSESIRQALQTVTGDFKAGQKELKSTPDQTIIMAEIWWPLVMTTRQVSPDPGQL